MTNKTRLKGAAYTEDFQTYKSSADNTLLLALHRTPVFHNSLHTYSMQHKLSAVHIYGNNGLINLKCFEFGKKAV